MNKEVGVIRIDPHVVIVAMGYSQTLPRLAPIDGFHVARCHRVNNVRILWIDIDIRVVERARPNR